MGALTIHSNNLYSNEAEANQADEIIVTSSYIDPNLSDLDDPIHILSGDISKVFDQHSY